MRYQTHIITSVTAAVALNPFDNIPLSLIGLVGVAAGSLLPDIDEPNSFVGKRTRGISNLVNAAFGHRGLTHSILAIFITFIPYFLLLFSSEIIHNHTISSILTTFFFGIGLGYAFHIGGDVFSKTGVPLFLPLSKVRIRIPIYKTGGIRELIIRYLTLVLLLYLLTIKLF